MKTGWADRYFMSPQRVAARAQLRSIARKVAQQTGKTPETALKALVEAQTREQYADSPEAIPEAMRFEMRLHDGDELRAATAEVLEIFEPT